MERQESPSETKRFGRFLRKVREGRKLSLDAVEEMSAAFPERLTKSHLSRIENGQAEPSFRKLFALSQIYGVPLVSLAEQYEVDLRRELVQVDLTGKSEAEIEAEALKLMQGGGYTDALMLLKSAIDRLTERTHESLSVSEATDWVRNFRLGAVNCLLHLGRYESAKLETEEILSIPSLPLEQRLRALQHFVSACYRLNRFTIAMMGLDEAERELDTSEAPPRMRADFAMLRGNILAVVGQSREAVASYTRALELYERIPNPFEACRTRVNLAGALIDAGDHEGAREQLEAALLISEAGGYDRQRALAMSHLAVRAYLKDDLAAAESWAIRSNGIARTREYISLVFRNCYYLWKVAIATGDEASVKANERTLRSLQRRVDDYLPEVEAFRAALAGGES